MLLLDLFCQNKAKRFSPCEMSSGNKAGVKKLPHCLCGVTWHFPQHLLSFSADFVKTQWDRGPQDSQVPRFPVKIKSGVEKWSQIVSLASKMLYFELCYFGESMCDRNESFKKHEQQS